MLKSFHHTGFVVADIDKSVAFYRDTIGLTLLHEWEAGPNRPRPTGSHSTHVKAAFLSLGNGHKLELIQYVVPPSEEGGFKPNDRGATHLAFYVKDLDSYHARISRQEMRFPGPPIHREENGRVVRKVIHGQDPDGNWLEFIQPVVPLPTDVLWDPNGRDLVSFFHTGFVVEDSDRSEAFYRDVLGMEHIRSVESGPAPGLGSSGIPGAHLKASFLKLDNGHSVELIQYIHPRGEDRHLERNALGATHLAFFVDDAAEYYSTMSESGLTFLSPPRVSEISKAVSYARDPDGNYLEFVELPERSPT